jgi:hypothetical protein
MKIEAIKSRVAASSSKLNGRFINFDFKIYTFGVIVQMAVKSLTVMKIQIFRNNRKP